MSATPVVQIRVKTPISALFWKKTEKLRSFQTFEK